jgi:hypothetical protein
VTGAPPSRPAVRLFLDSGVVVQGCLGGWGGAKAVLILAASAPERYVVVLADAVDREARRAIARLADQAPRDAALASLSGWLARVRLERRADPTPVEIRAHMPALLPVLRHANDLPIAVAALLAAPDWVLSTNTEHWTPALAPLLRARVAHPTAFLRSPEPPTGRDADP